MTSLSVVSYIERINRMYRLIRTESTGSRAELAGRMRVSERTVSNYLEELRLMGAVLLAVVIGVLPMFTAQDTQYLLFFQPVRALCDVRGPHRCRRAGR
jgi:transcriptional regulator with XRE-family HTH domain